MKKINIETEFYKFGPYIAEIRKTDTSWEYYLQHKDNGIVSLIFGCPKSECTYEQFLDLVDVNIQDDIKFYKENYEDEE